MTDDSISAPHEEQTQPTYNWGLQILWDFLDVLSGNAKEGSRLRGTLRFVVALVSVIAITYSTVVFASASTDGIVVLSPPLLATFVAGVVGFGIARATDDDEEQTS